MPEKQSVYHPNFNEESPVIATDELVFFDSQPVDIWTPKESASRLYAKKFREFANGCRLKKMCTDYGIICVVEDCPFERRARM